MTVTDDGVDGIGLDHRTRTSPTFATYRATEATSASQARSGVRLATVTTWRRTSVSEILPSRVAGFPQPETVIEHHPRTADHPS
jgi:hypothetical protein